MAGWSTSTQCIRWILKQKDLARRRKQANQRATEAVLEHARSVLEPTVADVPTEDAANRALSCAPSAAALPPEGSLAEALPGPLLGSETLNEFAEGAVVGARGGAGGDQAAARNRKGDKAPRGLSLPEPLTVEEERELCRHFEWKIVEVCRAFRFHPKVQSTAIQYFKRFFLNSSVMEHEPKHIMLTVIYVACKVDEVYVSADAFANGIQQDPQVVLGNELAVLQALDFDLICYGPLRSVRGLLCDWHEQQPDVFSTGAAQEVIPAGGTAFERLLQLASDKIPGILTTDAPLLFPPAQLALAAISQALSSPGMQALQPHFDAYVESVGSRAAGPNPGVARSAAALREAVTLICSLVKREGQKPAEERVKRIDRKLRYCRNPALLQEDGKRKRERREQSRAKRANQEPVSAPPQGMVVATGGARGSADPTDASSPLDEIERKEAKRRRSAGGVLHG